MDPSCQDLSIEYLLEIICATLLQYIHSLENPLVGIILLPFINFNNACSSVAKSVRFAEPRRLVGH